MNLKLACGVGMAEPVVIGFTQASYIFGEGEGEVSVCIEADGFIANTSSFLVAVVVTDDTADSSLGKYNTNK